MKIGRVIGTVVLSSAGVGMEGRKLLLVQPTDFRLQPAGEPYISVDAVGAGFGEFVFLISSSESSIPFSPAKVPADYCVIGIVDEVRVRKAGLEGVDLETMFPNIAGMDRRKGKAGPA